MTEERKDLIQNIAEAVVTELEDRHLLTAETAYYTDALLLALDGAVVELIGDLRQEINRKYR